MRLQRAWATSCRHSFLHFCLQVMGVTTLDVVRANTFIAEVRPARVYQSEAAAGVARSRCCWGWQGLVAAVP